MKPTKPSGIPWLGKVPANWEMKKIRFLFRFQSGGTPSTTNEAYWEGTLPWVSAKDMKKMWISDTEDHISEHALTESAANTVPPNSLLLLTRSGILQHTIPVCVNSSRMAINQDVKGCIPVANNVDVRFCAYFIHGSQEQLLPLWRQEGATVESLEFETVKNTTFALPPLPEQRAIAAFLDERTARIDGLLARKQRLVQLLKEKRQALITRAVTRGLDAKVKLKESGVPWLGEVPEHWGVKDLKHMIGPMEQGWSPQCDNYPADESEWGVLKAGCVNGTRLNEMENKRLPDTEEPIPALEIKPGDILMSRANTVDLIGSCGYVDKVRPRLILCDKLYRFHALPGVSNGRYLVHFLRSRAGRSYMEQNTSGASDSMQNIGQDVVRNIVMPCPPLKEQEAIVAQIESLTTRIDALITKVEQAVLRLQEYRTALISAAITGKVRVPH